MRGERDPERTQRAILDAAEQIFAQNGYTGTRIYKIAALARCNIRMLYHYFGSKEKIYKAVLERAHHDIRAREAQLHLEQHNPLDGLLALMDFSFDYFAENPQFEALLRVENMMRGKFSFNSRIISEGSVSLRDTIADLLRRGEKLGQIRRGLDPAQVYVTIAALSRFHLGYTYTLSAVLDADLASEDWRVDRRRHARVVLISYLTGSLAPRRESSSRTPNRRRQSAT